MVLTIQEKKQLIVDLHNQDYNTRVITERTHTSFGYIGAVRRDAAKDREAVEEQVQKASVSTQAYKLFTKGKNPVEVAITLNIREQEVDQYLKEYFKLQK